MATVEFGDDTVTVRPQSPVRQRAVRLCGGGLLLAFGLAAVAGPVDQGWSHAAGVILWICAAVALVAGACGGAIWWLVLAARDRRRAPEVIEAGTVRSGRSEVVDGTVTVTLELAGDRERTFSASGQSGALLATHFGRMLSAGA